MGFFFFFVSVATLRGLIDEVVREWDGKEINMGSIKKSLILLA